LLFKHINVGLGYSILIPIFFSRSWRKVFQKQNICFKKVKLTYLHQTQVTVIRKCKWLVKIRMFF